MLSYVNKEIALIDQTRKTQKPEKRGKALTDYEAEAAAIRAKTERLKALRLARDAANGPAATPSRPAAARPSKRAKDKSKAGGTLAEWLSDRDKDGHR
jgi:hypothetical protein